MTAPRGERAAAKRKAVVPGSGAADAKPAPRPRGRPRSAEQSRARLLEAAARVFSRRGFAGTTIRDIAKEAGIALGGLYFHFESKEDFATAVFEQGIRVAAQRVSGELAALPAGASPELRIRTAVFAHLRATVENGDFAVALRFARDVRLPAEAGRRYRRVVADYRELWQGLMVEGQRASLLRRDVSAGRMLFLLFGALQWLGEWYDPKGQPLEAIAEDFITLLFQGMRAQNTRAQSMRAQSMRA